MIVQPIFGSLDFLHLPGSPFSWSTASPSLSLPSTPYLLCLKIKQQKMFSVNQSRKYSWPAPWLMCPCVTVGFNFAVHSSNNNKSHKNPTKEHFNLRPHAKHPGISSLASPLPLERELDGRRKKEKSSHFFLCTEREKTCHKLRAVGVKSRPGVNVVQLCEQLSFWALPAAAAPSCCVQMKAMMVDTCRHTKEPIWTGVSAHLYQMLHRYICCHASLPQNGMPEMFVSSINPIAIPGRHI